MTKSIIYVKNNKTYLIGINFESKKIYKYDITTGSQFIQSYSTENLKVNKIRISSDKTSVIIIQLNNPPTV